MCSWSHVHEDGATASLPDARGKPSAPGNPPLHLQPQRELLRRAVPPVRWTHVSNTFWPAGSAETATLTLVRSVRALNYTFFLSSPACYLSQMSFSVMRYLGTSVCLQPSDSVKILIINLQTSLRVMSENKYLIFLALPFWNFLVFFILCLKKPLRPWLCSSSLDRRSENMGNVGKRCCYLQCNPTTTPKPQL